MKRMLLCLLLIGTLAGFVTAFADEGVAIDAISFPDAGFRAQVAKLDADKNGILSPAEASVTKLNVSKAQIADLTGIEHFTALRVLNCSGNRLTALDVRRNTALTELYCYNNQLSRLDVRYNTALVALNCQGNRLTALDLRFNKALRELVCSGNRLNALDISACPELVRCVREDLCVEDAEDGTLNYYREYDYSYYIYDLICDIGVRLSTAGVSYTTVRLPEGLTEIQPEAFQSIAAEAVICPDGLKSIGAKAFAGCLQLKEIRIPASVTAIASNAFYGCYDLVIVSDSANIQSWADSHGILWKAA